jgi:hypothetical protein
MATQLLATGSTAASTADVVVAAGTPVTLFLKVTGNIPVDANYTVRATIEIKDSDGSYHEVGALTGQDPSRVVDGPCTVRVSRSANPAVAFGIEQG